MALSARTGLPVWSHQATRHDLFDYDLPGHPLLVTITHQGRRIPVAIQQTKQGRMFVLDRDTGREVWKGPAWRHFGTPAVARLKDGDAIAISRFDGEFLLQGAYRSSPVRRQGRLPWRTPTASRLTEAGNPRRTGRHPGGQGRAFAWRAA